MIINQTQVFTMWPQTIVNKVLDWWLKRAESHYLMCAEVEAQRAKDSHANVAYYQRKAAFARSARIR